MKDNELQFDRKCHVLYSNDRQMSVAPYDPDRPIKKKRRRFMTAFYLVMTILLLGIIGV